MVALSTIAIVPATARAAAPVVVIAAPDAAVTGQPVAFDGSGTTDPDGDMNLDYAWAIDGQRLDVENPWLSVSFAHPGHHVVALTATDTGGTSATAQHGIDVTGADKSVSSLKPLGTSLVPGVTAVPEVLVRAPAMRLQKHRLRVVVRCRGTARCRGTLRIVALKGRRHTPFLLVQRRFDVASGGPRVLHARLSQRARRRLGTTTLVRANAYRGRNVRLATLWGTMSYRVRVVR